jgi:hypothetical protein
MGKPLSEQLADLSARAKQAEDAVAVAKQEAHDKVEARTEQARAVAAQQELLEWEAGIAVDYAIASFEQAKWAVLDAIVGRAEAQQAK